MKLYQYCKRVQYSTSHLPTCCYSVAQPWLPGSGITSRFPSRVQYLIELVMERGTWITASSSLEISVVSHETDHIPNLNTATKNGK